MNRSKIDLLLAGVLSLSLSAPATRAQNTSWQDYIEAGRRAYARGQYAEAEKPFLAALKEAEKFGSDDLRVSSNLHDLAHLYTTQEKYEQAEPLYQRALAITEKALGPDHPDVTRTLMSYANLLRRVNRGSEAEKLDARAKAILAKLGQKNPHSE